MTFYPTEATRPRSPESGTLATQQVAGRPTMAFVAAINSDLEFEVCGEAANGRECLDQVGSLGPNAVVLDISMPIMHGLEAARILRDTHPDLAVIIYSSFDGPALKHEADNVGARAVVSKSEPLEHLLKSLRSALLRREA